MLLKTLGFVGRCLLVLYSVFLGFNMLTDPDIYRSVLTTLTNGLTIQPLILDQARVVVSMTAIFIVMASFLTVLRVRTGVVMLIFVEVFHLICFAETSPVILRLCTIGALFLV
mmetsp:Transcript_24014/g.42624  ORF Transcript_24014/g.42624 Transcript_24014/m.42624 type:complete len:113 (-) Transcript_24014:1535-1873(-)